MLINRYVNFLLKYDATPQPIRPGFPLLLSSKHNIYQDGTSLSLSSKVKSASYLIWPHTNKLTINCWILGLDLCGYLRPYQMSSDYRAVQEGACHPSLHCWCPEDPAWRCDALWSEHTHTQTQLDNATTQTHRCSCWSHSLVTSTNYLLYSQHNLKHNTMRGQNIAEQT